MKKLLFISIVFFAIVNGNGQKNIVVFYFGSSSCGYCDNVELIQSIKKIKVNLPNKFPSLNIKFVVVCMDEDIEKGIEFIKKYDDWDEVSIGSHYNNELVMAYLNKTEKAGVPHLLVYKDEYSNTSTPIIKSRKIIVDKVGVTQILQWVKNNYPLNN